MKCGTPTTRANQALAYGTNARFLRTIIHASQGHPAVSIGRAHYLDLRRLARALAKDVLALQTERDAMLETKAALVARIQRLENEVDLVGSIAEDDLLFLTGGVV